MNPQHLAGSAEHYTPPYVVEPAREVLGGFDLDPASCYYANQVVQAQEYYTADDDGLDMLWHGNIFLNPPGNCGWRPDPTAKKGKRTVVCGNQGACSCKLVRKFWDHLQREYEAGRVTAAIWVGFSLEQLQSLQTKPGDPYRPSPLDYPICYPHKRVAYVGSSPTHASYIALLPNKDEDVIQTAKFARVFSPLGRVVVPINDLYI